MENQTPCRGGLSRIDQLFTNRIVESERAIGNTNFQSTDLTPEWVVEQRERFVYPNTRFSISSKYGGYNAVGLKFSTRSEVEAILSWADAWLSKTRKPST